MDQETTGPSHSGYRLGYLAPHGQEFVPSVAEHVGVNLRLGWTLTSPGFEPDEVTFSVALRSGSIAGPVLTTVTLPTITQEFYDEWVEFRFTSPMMLTPGELYVIDVTSELDNGWFYRVSGTDAYAPGSAIQSGVAQPFDWGFQTLVAIPEPSTFLMTGAGLLAMSVMSRRGQPAAQ